MSETEAILSPQQRRARREAQLERGRASVAECRTLLAQGRRVREQLGVSAAQIAAFVEERRAVESELARLKGTKPKRSKRIRTAV